VKAGLACPVDPAARPFQVCEPIPSNPWVLPIFERVWRAEALVSKLGQKPRSDLGIIITRARAPLPAAMVRRGHQRRFRREGQRRAKAGVCLF
jgi:hypothetical protein